MRLSGLIWCRKRLVYLPWCPRERGLNRLVPLGRWPGRGPYPPAIRPEPEQRAEDDPDVIGHDVGELAGLAEAVVSDADRGPLDDQPDPVQREKHHCLARNGGALPVPEAPVPVRHIADDRGDDDRDGRGRQWTEVQGEVHPAVDEVEDHDADPADDAELGALVDEQPETLIEPSHTAHRGRPPSTCATIGDHAITWRCYPHRGPPKRPLVSKHCRQDYPGRPRRGAQSVNQPGPSPSRSLASPHG